MPELLNRSVDEMLAAMAGQFGKKWPNPWWPKGISAYDDCAACVSYFLFGLNSLGNPFYSYVSQIQAWGKQRGVWHAGHVGLQRGDVVAFDWEGDGDPDHTEIVVTVSSGGSIVTSRGTNSNPGDDMRDRTRSAGYVLSYIRPPYPGTTTVSNGASIPIERTDDDEMISPEAQTFIRQTVQAAVAPLMDDENNEKDATRREGRLWRLFRNMDRPGQPDEFVAVAYGLPIGDPRQVIYVDRQTAIAMNGTYQMTADTPENAKALPAANIATTVRMANGTDRVYQNKPSS